MEDEYGMADLRQFISTRPVFPPIPPPPPDLHPYDALMFRSDSTTTPNTSAAVGGGSGGAGSSSGCFTGFDGGTGRWPRQETLTLLEIRSRLDPKFKEANQKGPLWDEVSR